MVSPTDANIHIYYSPDKKMIGTSIYEWALQQYTEGLCTVPPQQQTLQC